MKIENFIFGQNQIYKIVLIWILKKDCSHWSDCSKTAIYEKLSQNFSFSKLEKFFGTYLKDSKIGFSSKSHLFAVRRVGIVTVIEKPLFENFDWFFGQISAAFSSCHSRPVIGTSWGAQLFRAGVLIRRGTGVTFTPSNNWKIGKNYGILQKKILLKNAFLTW